MATTEQEIARFIYLEARLLDEARFDEWLAMFTDDGHYWMPLSPRQTDPEHEEYLIYEDVELLRSRIDRLRSPPAFSQQAIVHGHHLLQVPQPEQLSTGGDEVVTRTPFAYTESRGETLHRYCGTTLHTLKVVDGRLRIRLKRVDLLNSDSALPAFHLIM
ncbi:MAG: phenylpropionate dioxygenase [Betaproteobacteria bacterium]|nr:phenylpropionate dioxygenase [Betaproteobacteria bacterium]